jgi:hypothetical protein
VSTDVPAVGYGNRVQVETLGCYGYSTSATPPSTSNATFLLLFRHWLHGIAEHETLMGVHKSLLAARTGLQGGLTDTAVIDFQVGHMDLVYLALYCRRRLVHVFRRPIGSKDGFCILSSFSHHYNYQEDFPSQGDRPEHRWEVCNPATRYCHLHEDNRMISERRAHLLQPYCPVRQFQLLIKYHPSFSPRDCLPPQEVTSMAPRSSH